MEEEVKMLFQLAYHPVMYANQRLNGGDFLSVSIPLMDALREQTDDEDKLKKRHISWFLSSIVCSTLRWMFIKLTISSIQYINQVL